MATVDGNVSHQQIGDINHGQILRPKQKLCVLGVEESYGDGAGSNWNLKSTDEWSIESQLFNISTLTIGDKLFNDIAFDLINQKLLQIQIWLFLMMIQFVVILHVMRIIMMDVIILIIHYIILYQSWQWNIIINYSMMKME